MTGTPIRSFAGRDRAPARAALGLDADTPVLFVFGGSQAVRRLNRAVAEALPKLVEKSYVLHMTGEAGYADALKRRETLPAAQRARYKPYAFLRAEMTDALLAADLLVGRAGSSTLAEASALGLPMVVVPYPHASAHQDANARALAEAGAARIVPDEDFDGAALIDAAALLARPHRLDQMCAAARAFGRPGAADAVAELVLALAERHTLPSPASIEQLSRAPASTAAARQIAGMLALCAQPAPSAPAEASVRDGVGRGAARGSDRGGSHASGHGHPAPHRRQDVPPRALWRGSRRCASAARPTYSPRSTTSSSCAPSCASRARANCRTSSSGRGSDLVISDKGVRGLVIHNSAQQVQFEGTRMTADSGLPMAKAATLGRTEGLSGLEFGLAIPGTVGGAVWANAGAHESDIRSVLAEAGVLRATGPRRRSTATAWSSPTATARSSTHRRDAPDVVTWATST